MTKERVYEAALRKIAEGDPMQRAYAARDIAVAALRDAVEPGAEPTFVCIGNTFGRDDEGDVLVDWSNESYEPKDGTLLFLRLWTQEEIDEAMRRGEQLFQQLQSPENRTGES